MGKRKKAAGKTGKQQGSNKGRSGKAKAKPKKPSNRRARAAKAFRAARPAAKKAAIEKKAQVPKPPSAAKQLAPGGEPVFVKPMTKV